MGSRQRWWVWRAIGRNPLVRGADRLEAWAMILAAVCLVLVIPHAVTVGQNVHDEILRTAEIQAKTRTPTQATVTDVTPPIADEGAGVVTITWTANGAPHTGAIQRGPTTKVGDTIDVWVDQTGRRVPAPISAASAGTYAGAAAVSAWLGTLLLCGMALVAVRALLDRRRLRTWSAELRVLLDHGDGRTKWHH
ncbi:hypothetical protein ABQF34_14355 [Mycolicibacterium boenickei]